MFASLEYPYTENRPLITQRFKYLTTLKVAYFQLFLIFLVGFTAIGSFYIDNPTFQEFNKPGYLFYYQSILWLLTVIFYGYYRKRHRFLKLSGHFAFYKKVQIYVRSMVLIPSSGCAAIIFMEGVITDMNYVENSSNIIIIVCFEVLSMLSVLLIYIILVHKFNRIRPAPDTESQEYWLPCDPRCTSEIGYRRDGEAIADLLEKQADLIFYLKSSVTELNRRLALQSTSNSDNNLPNQF